MIPKHYMELFRPLDGVRTMLELGNKRGTEGPGDTYKAAFTALGIEHTSVDLNGMDGALPLDLRKPLGLGDFDMVSNIGTSEHVSEQEPVWRNMIEACRRALVCITPAPGDWPGHGLWYPAPGFYAELASLNGFALARVYQSGPHGRSFVYARLERRRQRPFTMPAAALIAKAPPRAPRR